MLQTTVILPCYNRASVLRLTLAGLAEQTASSDAFQVIVVDDGSNDGSVDVVQEFEKSLPVRLLRQDNRGPGAARNLGARHAAGSLLVFLDADMIPVPGLVEVYAAAFTARPGAVQIGRILARPDAFQTLFDRVTRAEMTYDLGPAPQRLVFYNLASGNFAVGAEAFWGLGGFDEALRMTEDTDLGYRAEQAGVSLQYCAEAVGYHNHPKTLDQRCTSAKSSAFWTAHLLAKHPEMTPLLPIYQDILPVAWGRDSTSLLMRKLGRRVLALPPTRRTMGLLIRALEEQQSDSALLRSLYYKLISGYRVEGFREGRQRSSVWPHQV